MTPQVNLDGRDRVSPSPTAAPMLPAERQEITVPRELTYAERQGLAMGWMALALGTFLLLGGLALWASVALSAGFGGWLISVAVMGVVTVAAIVAVSYFVIRPRR